MAEKNTAMEKTLVMIKPDAVTDGHVGKIVDMYLSNGFTIRASKKLQLSKHEAQQFYAVHRERPFYDSLTTFMSNGAIYAMVLEKENAIKENRNLMGATNPADAAEGTIRKQFAKSIESNAVHGSDAPETAAEEIAFFFSELELLRS